ncbi:MAG TPA: serine/threonine-protein kinase [Gammaproteobacteria bacterium]
MESNSEARSAARDLVVNGLPGASVQATNLSLDAAIDDIEHLRNFDVLLAGCDFSNDGSSENPVFRAVRTLAAYPAGPRVVLLPIGGSEYTAVQAIKAGAAEYVPRDLMDREQIVTSIRRATAAARPDPLADDSIDETSAAAQQFFGYDIRRRLAHHKNISICVAFSGERSAEVVLKVLHRDEGAISRDANFARFVKEFKLLHDIGESAVAEIYDFKVAQNYCYLAMEYFRLGHLGNTLSRPLESDRALDLAGEIARSLSIVHAAGVTHCDLKPSNIMTRENGSVALIDFGISRAITLDIPDTHSGKIKGTPYYMSPEQACGQPADGRTDLYALGVILFQMLSGRKPFVGDTPHEILEQHCNAPIPKLPDKLGHHQALVERLLAKDPEQRMSTAREAIGEIEDARTNKPKLDAAIAG